MKNNIICKVVPLLLLVLIVSYGKTDAESASQQQASSARELVLTIYNKHFGLVKDIRTIELVEGITELKYTEVAAKINPTSVHFKSLTAPDKVTVLEQNYEYDLVSADKLLQKYIDEHVKIFTQDDRIFEGVLLSYDEKTVVISQQLDDETAITLIQRPENIKHIEFTSLPQGLITRPTLVWKLQCNKPGKHRTEVSYLTEGINWHAEYIAVVDQYDKYLELSSWVSIDNRSGATYENTKLKLIAGEIHRVEPTRPREIMFDTVVRKTQAALPSFEERTFFEYHMYTLDRRTTIKDREVKQMTLFPSAKVPVNKIFTYDGARDNKKVRIELEFKNSKEHGLGIPLPQGKLRVYKEDVDHALEFVGEDRINHTPKDEKLRVFVGNAFDIVGERIHKEHHRISDRIYEDTYEIKLRNHKDESVQIVVVEHLSGDWEIIDTTHDYVKKDAYTIEFNVQVDKNKEEIICYTVRIEL